MGWSFTTHHSSLWERRARNKKSMILKGKQAESYKTNNEREN
jgi:hypothetical protein